MCVGVIKYNYRVCAHVLKVISLKIPVINVFVSLMVTIKQKPTANTLKIKGEKNHIVRENHSATKEDSQKERKKGIYKMPRKQNESSNQLECKPLDYLMATWIEEKKTHTQLKTNYVLPTRD